MERGERAVTGGWGRTVAVRGHRVGPLLAGRHVRRGRTVERVAEPEGLGGRVDAGGPQCAVQHPEVRGTAVLRPERHDRRADPPRGQRDGRQRPSRGTREDDAAARPESEFGGQQVGALGDPACEGREPLLAAAPLTEGGDRRTLAEERDRAFERRRDVIGRRGPDGEPCDPHPVPSVRRCRTREATDGAPTLPLHVTGPGDVHPPGGPRVVSVSQGFSLARRRSPIRLLRVLLRLVIAGLILALLWGVLVATLWLVASNQLRGVPLAALRDDVLMLGASGARSPEDATTVLLLMVEPLDPTVPRPTPLVGPPVVLQIGGAREVPAALVLPESVEVLVDGRGLMRFDEIQRELGADRLARAVIDYTEVRLDHVVAVSTEALPTLVRLLGPLEVCGGWGCDEPTPDDVRAWQRDPDPVVVLERGSAVLRAVAAELDTELFVRQPFLARQVVEVLSAQVVADADLGVRRLLDLASGVSVPVRLDVDGLPMVRNPSTGELVVLEESAMIRFQRLREGLPFEAIDPAEDVARLRTVTEVAVLNGAGVAGLAALYEAELRTAGFVVVGTGNEARFDRERTVINYLRGDREAEPVAFLLAEQLPGASIEPVDTPLLFEDDPVAIVVLLGRDLTTPGEG